jgi:hypothetical protein
MRGEVEPGFVASDACLAVAIIARIMRDYAGANNNRHKYKERKNIIQSKPNFRGINL